MSKCNLSIIFSLLNKLLKLMHLDTGGKEIFFSKVFSHKKIQTETTYNSSFFFSQLIDFSIEGESKSFMYSVTQYSNQ
jgi:hypothetical protein